MGKKIPLEKRFWGKVNKTPSCWFWIGKTTQTGYGQIQVGSRTDNSRKLVYVHRLVFEMQGMEIPKGMTVNHICRNRNCVNPSHLEILTLRDNLYASPAYQGNKTTCKNGHLLVQGDTQRYCTICKAEAAKRYRMKHPERCKEATRRWRSKQKANH